MSNVSDSELAGSRSQPEAITPRHSLPDEWSGRGACPLCREVGQLRVRHLEGAPDQMVCSACGTTFQVESGGPRIRLAAGPAAVPESADFLDTWLTPSELRACLEAALALQTASPAETPAASGPSAPKTGPGPAPVSAQMEPAPAVEPTAAGPERHAAEPEPGTDDWYASLAAAIGGLSPVAPTPDHVLADELERLLTTRDPGVSDGAESPGQPAAPVADAKTPMVAETGPAADTTPSDQAEPRTRAATAPLRYPKAEASVPTATVVSPDAMPDDPAILAKASAPSDAPDLAAVALEVPAEQPPNAIAAAAPLPETQAVTSLIPASLPAAPGPSPSRHDLAERAWKLHELGNSLASIRFALASSGGTPEDVAAIMGKLEALEQTRRARFRRNLQLTLGSGLIVVLVLLVIAAMITLSPAPAASPTAVETLAGSAAPGTPAAGATPAGSPTAALGYNPLIALLNQVLPGDVKIANGPSPTPAPTSALLSSLFPATPTLSPADRVTAAAQVTGLPSWVSTLVPSGITVINVPTPSLDTNGPPTSPCPTTADQASALFGGQAANWTYNRSQQGWIFILANSPTSIRVPANMSAGYLALGETLEMRSVLGPATIHNVNFAAVSCGL